MLIGLIGFSSCVKENPFLIPEGGDHAVIPATQLPFIKDTYVSIITPGIVFAGFNIIDDGGGTILTHGVCWSTSRHPTAADNYVEGRGPFSKDGRYYIGGLKVSTTYYLRAFASNSLGTAYGEQISFTTPVYFEESAMDIDGNIYKTVQIGTQTWMAENLRTTRYNDGSRIPNVNGSYTWVALNKGAYCWYKNDSATFKYLYGALYNYYAVNAGNLCPTGWHVPTDEEWKKLEMALGMTQAEADISYLDFDVYGMGFRGTDQGTRLKATTGWSPWEGRGGNGTNTSGFTALPAGDTGNSGTFSGAGVCTSFWCNGDPWARTLSSDESGVSRALYDLYIGFSVRCLKY